MRETITNLFLQLLYQRQLYGSWLCLNPNPEKRSYNIGNRYRDINQYLVPWYLLGTPRLTLHIQIYSSLLKLPLVIRYNTNFIVYLAPTFVK